MNQQCKVCGEPAAGFHFGAFTCEGCKSFFGRSYNNLSSITECKNGGECVINKKNRTACKACRLKKCLLVGMSKSGSRYGRRSNWFKIHCLLQEQQQAALAAMRGKSPPDPTTFGAHFQPSAVPSPDSESSETPFLPLTFPTMFLRPPPYLLHPHMFPFPPTPPLKPAEEDIKPAFNNNNYDSRNQNIEKDPKRFYLDAILGLKPEAPSPVRESSPPSVVQDNPIDLSLRGVIRPRSEADLMERHRVSRRQNEVDDGSEGDDEEEEHIDVVHGHADEHKAIPLDLSV